MGETRAVAEAPEERALADVRGLRDRVHRHVLDAALVEQPCGDGEDPGPVARGVGALARLAAEDGQHLLGGGRELCRGSRHAPSIKQTGP